MNKSLSVFLSVLLCIVLYVGVLLVRYTTDESDYWQSSQVYTSSAPAGAPAVSFGVGANGDVLAVPMSSRYSSREQYLQSSWRSTGVANLQVFSRSANSTGMLSHPSLQGGDGGRLFTHMSSSQTMKSFGGGNSSAGVSVSGGVVSTNNFTTSSPNNLITSSPNTPLTSSPNSLITSSPTSLLALSPNSLITSSPLAANYQGLGNATIGDPRGMRGRRNAPTFNDPWWVWFNDWITDPGNNGSEYGTGNENEYVFDKYSLYEVYQSFLTSYWNSGMGNPPSYEEWLDWYQQAMIDGNGSYTFDENTYFWQPVGDVLPLLLLAFLYIAAIYIRFRFRTQSNG